MTWLETYRGTVNRWEVDNVDHFTVAFYFVRLEDATGAFLTDIGLDRAEQAAAGRVDTVTDCRVRYLKELRVGDVFHVRSGVLSVEDDAVQLVHELWDSGDSVLCTTVEERIALVEAKSGARLALSREQKDAAAKRRVDWTPEPDRGAARALPEGDAGFIDSSRDTIKPSEVNTRGEAAPAAYIHRFTAANGHVLAAFGMTPAYMRDEHRGLSTFEFRLRFFARLRAGDPVLVRSGLVQIGNSSMRIFHRMTNARSGERVATLEQSGVHLDMTARRPAPLPDELRRRATAILAR